MPFLELRTGFFFFLRLHVTKFLFLLCFYGAFMKLTLLLNPITRLALFFRVCMFEPAFQEEVAKLAILL